MFLNEILEKFGFSQQISNFCIINFANKGICIQGKTKILHLSTTKIVLYLQKEKVFIYGNNLQLKGFEKTEINIVGQIVAVSQKEILLSE